MLTAPIARAASVSSSQCATIACLCGTVATKPPKFCCARSPASTVPRSSGFTWIGTMTPSKPCASNTGFISCGAFTW